MATFIPIVTNSHPVTITTGIPTLTYSELVSSIASGGFQIKIKEVYIYASSYSQLSNSWYLTKFSQSGASNVVPDSYTIDPNQFQPAAFWKFDNEEFVIDNLTSLNLTLDPNSSMQLVFFAEQRTNMGAYSGNTNDAKKQINTLGSFGNKNNEEDIVLTESGERINKFSNKTQSNNIDFKKAAIAATVIGLGLFGISKI